MYMYCYYKKGNVYLKAGFSLRILVAGERCNVTGEYFERGSTSEYKIVIGYRTFAGESCIVNGEFSDRRSQMNTLSKFTSLRSFPACTLLLLIFFSGWLKYSTQTQNVLNIEHVRFKMTQTFWRVLISNTISSWSSLRNSDDTK